MIKVAPSLLAADFAKLGQEVDRAARAGADYLHFDVMDGHFVPNISFGFPLLKAVAQGPLPVDVHLMIEHPESFIDEFARCGAKIITVHAEATNHLHRALQQIRACGCLAGVALNPGTSPECLKYVLDLVDLVLVMTVNPGFGGQKMIPACVDKIGEVRAILNRAGRDAIIEVDGGVNMENAAMLKARGATMLVAGSAFYGGQDDRKFVEKLKSE